MRAEIKKYFILSINEAGWVTGFLGKETKIMLAYNMKVGRYLPQK